MSGKKEAGKPRVTTSAVFKPFWLASGGTGTISVAVDGVKAEWTGFCYSQEECDSKLVRMREDALQQAKRLQTSS